MGGGGGGKGTGNIFSRNIVAGMLGGGGEVVGGRGGA